MKDMLKNVANLDIPLKTGRRVVDLWEVQDMLLSKGQISDIESKAATVLQNIYPHGVDVPIDLQKILQSYQIQLKVGDFENFDIAGAYDRSQRTIYISESAPYQRNAFTVAHELGHFFLHENKPNEVFYRLEADMIKTQEDDRQESEANWFAASLLMPREAMIKYHEIFDGDTNKMVVLFGVSKAAMYWRSKNMGLVV